MGATPVATGGGGGGGGSGTVTSVALSAPAEFSVTGSPITTAGTLVLAWQSVAANRVMASPDGASGTPAFRALVVADLPDLSGTYAALSHTHAASAITSGTFDVARIPWATATDIGGTSRPAIYAGAINMTGSITHNSGLLSLNAASGYQVQMYAGAALVADVSATAATFLEPLTVAVSSSDTNAVRTLATLSHAISGLAAPGLGVGINFDTETPTQVTPTTIAKLEATFQSDVDELARISMSARYGVALYEVFRVETTRFGLRNVGLGTFTITGYPAVAIGSNAQATGNAVAVGRDTLATVDKATAIGFNSQATASRSVALGGGQASNVGAAALTSASYANGEWSIAAGYNSQSPGYRSVALGYSSYAPGSYAVALGDARATINYSVVANAAGGFWPVGIDSATQQTAGVYGRRGSGTNSAGSDIEIGAGASTGNAVGGSLRLKTAPAGASGSALNALVDRIVITSAGAIGLFGATPVAQAAHIADPTGGATVDAEARTAINAILVVLENIGIAAAS